MKKKRGYSREFTPEGEGARYDLDAIPESLWKAFRQKCKRQGVSLRARILTLIKQDTDAEAQP